MKKALFAGILASFFFAFTFILNRSMHLGGGSWVWSACLRYYFTLPILWAVLLFQGKGGLGRIFREIRRQPLTWLWWSTVGFGLFYAPLSLGSQYGEAWLTAATWQVTIVAGVLLTPLFGHRIPMRQLGWSMVILVGIFVLQASTAAELRFEELAQALLPILLAAVCYPLGNRKLMQYCPPEISTLERVFGMTLCSMPFWLVLGAWGVGAVGLPSAGQVIQSVGVALFSCIKAYRRGFQT